jgi:hypothetical protein
MSGTWPAVISAPAPPRISQQFDLARESRTLEADVCTRRCEIPPCPIRLGVGHLRSRTNFTIWLQNHDTQMSFDCV